VEVDAMVLEYVRTLGPDQLPPSFVYRGPMGIGRDGRLVVSSNPDCKVAVLHAHSGMRDRYFGRCGDGPHETRVISGIGLIHDTIIRIAPFGGTIAFVGPDDTVVKRVRADSLVKTSIRNVHSFDVIDDTTAFVTVVRLPAALADRADDWLFAEVDLRTGAVRPNPYREPLTRSAAISETLRFYAACTHRRLGVTMVANNGPVELVALAPDGAVRWAVDYSVGPIRPVQDPLNQTTAAFRWNRLPVGPTCSASLVALRALPIDGSVGDPALGNLILVDATGTTRMNLPLGSRDSVLALGGWEADDSLFYVTARQASTPAVVVLRPRLRRAGERGAILLPDSVQQRLDADPLAGLLP
jgi:hypothetical protein